MLGLQLEHPNVVRTFKHSTVLVQARCIVVRVLLRKAMKMHRSSVAVLANGGLACLQLVK